MGIHLTWFALVLTISAIEPGNHENALPCLQQRHLHVLQCFRDPCPQKACCAVLHYLHVLTAPMKLPMLCRYVQRAQHGAGDHMGQLQDPNVMYSVVLCDAIPLLYPYTAVSPRNSCSGPSLPSKNVGLEVAKCHRRQHARRLNEMARRKI